MPVPSPASGRGRNPGAIAGAKLTRPDRQPVEKDMFDVIGLETLLAVERATVERNA